MGLTLNLGWVVAEQVAEAGMGRMGAGLQISSARSGAVGSKER